MKKLILVLSLLIITSFTFAQFGPQQEISQSTAYPIEVKSFINKNH